MIIQSMPEIWDHTTFTTSRKTILGALASCVVRLSPYIFPRDLALGWNNLILILLKFI